MSAQDLASLRFACDRSTAAWLSCVRQKPLSSSGLRRVQTLIDEARPGASVQFERKHESLCHVS